MEVPPYPWPALWRTLLLWLSFLAIGLSDSIRGPTLLDLRDLVATDTASISSTFALRSLGGLLGSLATGLLLDRLTRAARYLALAAAFLLAGLTTAALPHVPTLLLMQVHHALTSVPMQVVSLTFGLCNGVIHTASNILLLHLWAGRNSSPYMWAPP